jgi:hypothetical protein
MMMTKLEQLINELCPEGVEYCELGKVCSLVTGATPSKVKSDYWENGTIPWMSSGEVNNKIIYDTFMINRCFCIDDAMFPNYRVALDYRTLHYDCTFSYFCCWRYDSRRMNGFAEFT